ncbi:unnamed protein product [Musa acuminata subsp. burmannicoides]
MIGGWDVLKVIEAMTSLYVALGLGHGSVRWWHIFTREQVVAINRLIVYFTILFFTFEFTDTNFLVPYINHPLFAISLLFINEVPCFVFLLFKYCMSHDGGSSYSSSYHKYHLISRCLINVCCLSEYHKYHLISKYCVFLFHGQVLLFTRVVDLRKFC